MEMYHHGVNCVEISSRSLDHGVVSNICLGDVGLCFDTCMEYGPFRYTRIVLYQGISFKHLERK